MDPIAELRQLRDQLNITNPDDADRLTSEFFNQIGLPARWRPWMAPFVRNTAREILRNAVRRVEQTAPLPGTPSPAAGTAPATTTKTKTKTKTRHPKADPQAERRNALDQQFYNGSKWVTWGEATIDDHQSRIDYMTRDRDGIDRDIARHAEAIDMLLAAGATCLNDLEP